LLRRLGFDERIRGRHHIFTKEGIEEILKLQPRGRHAKPYQVKQVRYVILKYRLGGQDDEHRWVHRIPPVAQTSRPSKRSGYVGGGRVLGISRGAGASQEAGGCRSSA